MIFYGIFDNGFKYKGKEDEDNKLIFDGEYKNGKKWNGIIKDYKLSRVLLAGKWIWIKGRKKLNIVIGKQYNYKGILIFEGEYKDCKYYKGKEYDYGTLIFDGEYKDNEYYEGIFNNIDNPGEICGKLIKGNSNNIECKKKVYIDITLIFKGDYKEYYKISRINFQRRL